MCTVGCGADLFLSSPDLVAEPVYETLPGWKESSAGIREFALLPDAARRYVDRLSDLCGVEIGIVSTGPDRNHTTTSLLRGQSALSSWFE